MYKNYSVTQPTHSQPRRTYIPYTGAREYSTSRSPSPIPYQSKKSYFSTSKKPFYPQSNSFIQRNPSIASITNNRPMTPNTKYTSYISGRNTPLVSSLNLAQPGTITRVSNPINPVSPVLGLRETQASITTSPRIPYRDPRVSEPPLCFFERIQEIDDYQSKQIKDFMSQAARNLADCGEAIVASNYRLTANRYPGKKRYLEEFNRRAMEVNDDYRRNLIFLIEDLRKDMRKEPDARTDVRELDDILDFIQSRRMPHYQLRGQLNEISVCCDPELTGNASRRAEESKIINSKRNEGAVEPVMPPVRKRPLRRSSSRGNTSRRDTRRNRGGKQTNRSSYYNTRGTSRNNSFTKINRTPSLSSSRINKSPEKQESIYTVEEIEKPDPIDDEGTSFYTPPKTYKKPEIVQIVNMEPQIVKKNSVKRSTLKTFELTEEPDAQIINKKSYFSNFKSNIFQLDDIAANKIAMNKERTNLFLTGVEGTTILDCNGPDLNINQLIPEASSTTVKCIPGKMTILQETNTNNLSSNILGLGGLKQIAMIEGQFEKGKVIEDFHCYRHSLDDYYFLWRSGQDNLAVVDLDNFEVNEEIKAFWTFENISTMPVAACADRAAERILATSQAGADNYILHFFEDSPENSVYFSKPCFEVIPSVNRVTCMDVSFDESRVYLAGTATLKDESEIALVIACEFNQTLKEISAVLLGDLDYGIPRRMKRIKGSEMLLLGCDKHFAVLEFKNQELNQITNLPNVHDNEICDFVLKGKFLYSKAYNEPLIKVTEFDLPKDNLYQSNMIGSSAFTNFPPATRDSGYNNASNRGAILQDQNFNSPYHKFYRKQIVADGMRKLEKVTTSIDGTKLYLGGKGLHLFKYTKDGYMASDIDRSGATSFFALRTTNSGNIVIQEPVSNNMIVLTGESFQVVKVLKGKQKCVFNSTYLRNPHFTGEDNTVVWFCGTSTIAIVNFDNLQPFLIENFLPFFSDSQFGIATKGVSKDQGNAIFCTFVMNNSFFFATYFKKRKPQQKKVSRFFKNMYKLYALELSLTKSVIFCGGASRRDKNKQTRGILAAVTFNESLEIITEKVLDDVDVQTCTALRRFRDRDDIVVGCMKNLLVVEFNQSEFIVKNVVYGLHTYSLTDIWIFGDRIFTVCRKDDFACEVAFRYEG